MQEVPQMLVGRQWAQLQAKRCKEFLTGLGVVTGTGFAWGRSVKGKVEVIGERAISVQAFRKVRWHLGRGARRSPGVDPTWEVGKPIGRTRSYDALPGSLARLRE